MITDILTLTPDFNFKETIQFKTIIDESESGQEMPDALIDNGLREFNLTVSYVDQTMMDYIWNFYISRQGRTDDFLMKIITNFSTTDEPVGTGDGTTRAFLLHNFPVDTTANNSAKINGIANALYTLSNDTANEKSYITFNSPPSLGDVITASYEYYFRVRFKEDRLTRKLMNYKLLSGGIDLVEVRWNTYFPFSGNSSSSSSSSSQGGITEQYFSVSDIKNFAGGGVYTFDPANFLRDMPKHQGCAQTTMQMNFIRMMIYLNTPPGLGKKRVFTLYLNDEPTNMTLSIADLATSGEINGFVQCQFGDYVFMRMDSYNSPATSDVCCGFNTTTTDPRRQPLLGPGDNGSDGPVMDYNGSSIVQDDGLGNHSMVTSPGFIRNLHIQATNVLWDTPSFTKLMKLVKMVGLDRFYEADQLQAEIIPPARIASNTTNNMLVLDGDFISYTGTFTSGVGNESFYSCEFYSFYPKHGIHASLISHASPTQVGYSSIHGLSSFEALNDRKEIFTVFPTSGIIKNLTIFYYKRNPASGYPHIYTLRKNGVDTNIVLTITNTVTSMRHSGQLRVAAFDRVSMKLDAIGSDIGTTSSESNIMMGWTFVSDNGGEWPLFSNLFNTF